MKKCQNCGFENEDTSIFCSECGTKIEVKIEKVEQKFCKNCGTALEPGALFCGECGKPVQRQKPVVEAIVVEQEPQKKKVSIVPIVIVAIALVLVLGLGVFFVVQSGMFGGGSDSDDDKKVEANLDDEDEIQEEPESEVEENFNEVAELDTSNPIPLAASVNVSSAINEVNNAYALTDADVSTYWAEGVGGFGEGEYITYTFQSDVYVYGVAILPGDLTSSSNFYNNAYPTELVVSNGDISQTVAIAYYTPNFDFSGNPYLFYAFSEPLYGDNITVTINAVKEGSGSQITCITEMHLFTYAEVGSNISVDPNAWAVTVSGITTSAYMLPTSNSEYLTMEDLEGFTAEDCRIARNELYARYGRKFTDETLRAYFESKEWYVGIIEPDDFTEDMLNEFEIYNRDLIVEYEEQNGFR